MRLSYHRAVQGEIEDICSWYDERKGGLGDEFFQELERILSAIFANPKKFPPATNGRRKAPLKRFPYSVSYRILNDRIRILAVHHNKRHPSYGSRRT